MIFEYQTASPFAEEADGYLNLMDVEDWQLLHFSAISFSAEGQRLRILILHRRQIDPEREAAHIAQVRRRRKAA